MYDDVVDDDEDHEVGIFCSIILFWTIHHCVVLNFRDRPWRIAHGKFLRLFAQAVGS